MAANTSTLADPADGHFDDWFELYNAGNQAVDLSGYTLTDTTANPEKYVVPAGVIIPAGGFLLVWADEDSGQTRTNGDLHVNFQLSQGGELIALYEPAPSRRQVDLVSFGRQTNDVSQGRYPDGQAGPFVFMSRPTPRRPNRVDPLTVDSVAIQVSETGSVTLRWQADPGRSYQVECKDDLGASAWSRLPGDVAADAGGAVKIDAPEPGVRQRFYRVLLLP
jgi:hypothetical protein